MSDEVLVVAAHPDDEVLGCAGTVALHTARGDRVLILAEGATSRRASPKATDLTQELQVLRRAAGLAAQALGAAPPRFANLPDNRLDSLDLLEIV